MLAADTSDALVALPADETPACVWTPFDAEVTVSPVDSVLEDTAPVPRFAIDLLTWGWGGELPLTAFDPAVLSVCVVDLTGSLDGTSFVTDDATQETDTWPSDTGIPDGCTDGSTDGTGVGVIDASDDQGLLLDHMTPR
jgi:hypothetical protein